MARLVRSQPRTEEIADFRDQFRSLYADARAQKAEFSSMEPWLRLSAERTDGLGHVRVSGEARTEPFFAGHNILSFVLELDQSYLPPAIAQLDEVVSAFPVIGSPND